MQPDMLSGVTMLLFRRVLMTITLHNTHAIVLKLRAEKRQAATVVPSFLVGAGFEWHRRLQYGLLDCRPTIMRNEFGVTTLICSS